MAEEQNQEKVSTEIPKGKKVGKITHYFGKIGVGVIKLEANLKVGDTIVIAGRGKEFEQSVESMQVEHQNIPEAKAGQSVGLKVANPVKEGDVVYLKAE